MTVDPASEDEVEEMMVCCSAPQLERPMFHPDEVARLLSRLTLSEETARAATERAVKAEAERDEIKGDIPSLMKIHRFDHATIASLQSQVEAMRVALEQAEKWLEGWASAESQLAVIRSTLAALGQKETDHG